jgi:hypothetical protein
MDSETRTEEPAADAEDHAMEQAEVPEPADSSSPPETDEERQHQADQHERLFGSSASTAMDAPDAGDAPEEPDEPDEAPAVLNNAQKERLLAAIEEMRRSSRNVNTRCLGWRLEYTLRKNGGTTRGDMMAVDPADGQKLFSIVSVKRKLGMVAPAPPPQVAPSAYPNPDPDPNPNPNPNPNPLTLTLP